MNWNLFENSLINTSFGLLLISLINYWISLIFTELDKLQKIGTISTICTNICISASLSIRWINNKYFPLSNLYESLLFLAWCITLTQIILEYRNKSAIIGSISSPINLFIIAFAGFFLPPEMQKASPLVPALRSNWLMMHVTIMLISYAALMLGSLLSILFLIVSKNRKIEIGSNSINRKSQSYKINNRTLIFSKNTDIKKMSLLESIDNLSYRVIGFGFPLLTIGIIAGAVWANEAWGSYWSWDPKETWALITWLIFASYLHSRFSQSWKGRKPAILASIGFFAVWICYLGVNFLGKGLHSYGWLQ